MKHKVATLEGALLDAAVALAEGLTPEMAPYCVVSDSAITFVRDEPSCMTGGEYFEPSTDWRQGGPIIERNWRSITAQLFEWFGTKWRDSIDGKPGDVLVWFMRAFVAGMFGEEVELPEPAPPEPFQGLRYATISEIDTSKMTVGRKEQKR